MEKKRKPQKAQFRVISKGVEHLPCKLTDHEKLDHAQQLAQVEGEIRAHNEHAKGVKQQLKSEEARLASELCRLAGIVRRGAEDRPVQTEFRQVGEGPLGRVYRIDTMEVIRERALTDAEMQGELFEQDPTDGASAPDSPRGSASVAGSSPVAR